MPVTVVGRGGAVWGLNEQSGLIAQTGEADASVDENPSKNTDGEVEMTSFYNPTRSIEIGGIYTGFADVLGEDISVSALLLIGKPNGRVNLKGLRTSQGSDGFVGIHLRGIQYDLF